MIVPGEGRDQSDESADAGSLGSEEKKAAEPVATLEDRALEALDAAVAITRKLDLAGLARSIKAELESFLDALMERLGDEPPEALRKDACENPDRVVMPFCRQLKRDRDKAASRFSKAKAAAALDFQMALETWSQAVSRHELEISAAKLSLDSAVEDAGEASEDKPKKNEDSFSRNPFRYFTVREAVASAVQAYEESAAQAASALAAEAGNLLAAHTLYIAAIGAAQAARLAEEAVAEQIFWQGVETARDTV